MNELHALMLRIRGNELTEADRDALLSVVSVLGGDSIDNECLQAAAHRVARRYLGEVIGGC